MAARVLGEEFAAPELSDVQQRALASLQADGVATISFSDLFGDETTWAALESEVRDFVTATERDLPSQTADDRKQLYGKSFLVRRFRERKGEPRARHCPDSPWLRFGVSPELLGIVNAYRGRLMRLNDIDIWYTVPNGEADARIASQRWHRDGWEENLIKVFTYFSDVDGDAGPFEYVRGSIRGGKYGSLWPWAEKEVYPPQDELEREIEEVDRLSLTGPSGTIVICDTSGFHRGGFARTKARILAYHTYLSADAQQRHRRKFEVDWDSAGETLSGSARYALE
jgi:hypothetical protein